MSGAGDFLVTKMLIPKKRRGLLQRRRLLDFLHKHIDRKLVLISAAAGYGKTSLLIDFAHDTDLPVCWYAFDETDRDPKVFLEYLVATIRQRFPEFGRRTQALLGEVEGFREHIQLLVTTLVKEIQEAIPEHFVLVLDDYHLAGDSQPIEAFFELFLRYLPENCHIILASRTMPKLPGLLRLAAYQEVAGLSTSDLRFTAEELQTLLQQEYNLYLPDAEAQTLAKESEGWITGILLTVHQFWPGRLDAPTLARGPRTQVFRYLATEVFAQQPEEIQRFLVASSILRQMDPALCDELLGIGQSGELLKHLEQRNLFISEIQEDRYAYQPLFREFLESRLEGEERDNFLLLHRRAGILFESRNELEAAIYHYTCAHAEAEISRLTERVLTEKRSTWKPEIETLLLSGRVVNPDVLTVILSGLKEAAIRRYFLEQQDEFDLQYEGDSSTLVAAKASVLRDLITSWDRSSRALSTMPNQFAQGMTEIISQFCGASGARILGVGEKERLYSGNLHAFMADISSAVEDARISGIVPLIFHQRQIVQDTDIDSLLDLLSRRLGSVHRVALLVLFCNRFELERARRMLHNKMTRIYAYDVIAIGLEDLQRMIISRDPQRALRRLLLSNVDLLAISPFVITGSTPDDVFFGREKELREITDHAAAASYALIGGRRIGKTSILKRLDRVRLPATGFCALYHDCSFTPTQAELVQAVAADKTWFPEKPTSPLPSFAEIIHALPDDKPLVILLDEADKLIEPDRQAGYRLFNTLRAMTNAGRCRFVLSGEQALRTELTNPKSPLYNFANEMLIGRLDFRAVEELVTRPMKQLEIELADEAEMVQRIWDFTSGHPNVVQRLCQRLIVRLNQRGDRRLTLNDVEAVVVDPDFLRKDFLNVYWERATALERLCSLVMAPDDSVRTLTAVQETLDRHDVRTTLNEVDDALERLVDLRNILQRTTEGYEFAVTAFPEVIAKTARLDDLIALNREAYQRYGDVEPRSKRGSP